MKILLWIVFIGILLLGLRVLNIAKAKQRDNARRSSTVPPPEPMIRCTCCGVYLPQKDAMCLLDTVERYDATILS